METKELRKLNKKDLLELLLLQKKRIDDLEKEISKLKNDLKNKKIDIEKSGNIAEAALKLNNIFEVAQKAADQYLYNIKKQTKKVKENKKTK